MPLDACAGRSRAAFRIAESIGRALVHWARRVDSGNDSLQNEYPMLKL